MMTVFPWESGLLRTCLTCKSIRKRNDRALFATKLIDLEGGKLGVPQIMRQWC